MFVFISYLFKTCKASVVCVTEQHYFRYSSLVYGLCANFHFSGTWVDWWLISKTFILLCLLAVWFCMYKYAQLRILKFKDSVYQKAEVCAQTINEWRTSKRSVVLLRKQLWFSMFTFSFQVLDYKAVCSFLSLEAIL